MPLRDEHQHTGPSRAREGADDDLPSLPEQFEVRGVLGRGGMGVVLEAHDTRLGRDVAVKVLPRTHVGDESSRRRFVREARAAAMLRDPSIVTVHELSSDGDYIVMELVRGETLRQRLARARRLSSAEVRQVGETLCRALGVAHAAGIVHRDVKPSNVLFDESGAVKLADFGVASFLDSDLTITGVAIGSPAYMAPEQLRGGAADPRADVYAVGATLFEAATGDKLHGAGGTCRDPQRAVHEATGDRALAAAIARAVSERPEDRPASSAALAEELAAAGAPSPLRRVALHGLGLAAVFTVAAAVSGIVWPGAGDSSGGARTGSSGGAPAGQVPAKTAGAADGDGTDGRTTVAILPFEISAGDPSLAFAANGIPHLLGRELGRGPGLVVIGHARLLDNLDPERRDTWFDTAVGMGADLIVHGGLASDNAGEGGPLELTVDVERRNRRPVAHVTRTLASIDALPVVLRSVAQKVASSATGGPVELGSGQRPGFEAERELEVGLDDMDRGQFGSASHHFRAALSRQPDFAEASYYLAMVSWWVEGDPSHTVELIDEALDRDLDQKQRQFLQAYRLLVDIRFPQAIDAFVPLSRRHPDDLDILYGTFEALFHGGHAGQALEVYRHIRRLAPRYRLALLHCFTYALAHLDQHAGDLGWILGDSELEPRSRGWTLQAAFARRDYRGAERMIRQLEQGWVGEPNNADRQMIADLRVQLAAVTGDVTGALARTDSGLGDAELTRYGLHLAAGGHSAAERWRAAAHRRADKATGYPRIERLLDLGLMAASSNDPQAERQAQTDLTDLGEPMTRSLSAAATRVLLARDLGQWRQVDDATRSPYPEVAAMATALIAERDGRLDQAARAWRTAIADTGDGSHMLFDQAGLARVLRAAGDFRGVLAACDEALRPRLFNWTWGGLVGSCLMWSGEAAAHLGQTDRARGFAQQLLDQRAEAPAGDPLLRAAQNQLKELSSHESQ